jgi:hypothetical protein
MTLSQETVSLEIQAFDPKLRPITIKNAVHTLLVMVEEICTQNDLCPHDVIHEYLEEGTHLTALSLPEN